MDMNNIKPVVFDPKFLIPNDIVDDVVCRFLLNIPKEEKFDPIRVCFQIELAHWYFTDYHCKEGSSIRLAQLRGIPYNQFAYIMYQNTPHLRNQIGGIDVHLAAFRDYKMRVPTFGAILLNQKLTKCVLVQGFRNNWGFPKGKVNQEEDPVACAAREVFEETGYDISPLVNKNHYIESKVFERNDRLYLVRGVDTNFKFNPQTLFEIKNIRWFNINELPESKKDTNPLIGRSGVPASNFYTVYPYIRRLRMWIADKLEGRNKVQNFRVIESDSHQNVPNVSSNQRKGNKSHQANNTPKNVLESFQFPQHFLQSGGGGSVTAAGWQLFPVAQQQDVQKTPQVMSSNVLEELLFSQQNMMVQQQQQQQPQQQKSAARQNSGQVTQVTGSGNKNNQKNPRRRLFTDETSALVQNQQNIGVIGKPSSASFTGNKKKSGHMQQYNMEASSSRTSFNFNAPAWTDFKFDRERVYKAFFTPQALPAGSCTT